MAKETAKKLVAYRLAQLSPKDRSWLLRQLSAEEREAIDGYLKDLRHLTRSKGLSFKDVMGLGNELSSGPAVAGQVANSMVSNEHTDDVEARLRRCITQTSQAELASILDRFSPHFAAVLIRACERLSSKYLAFCSPERGRVVRTAVRNLPEQLPRKVVLNAEKILVRSLEARAS